LSRLPEALRAPPLDGLVALPPGTAGRHAVKLARSVYSGRIARILREAIVDGRLAEGTALIETQLAAQLSVSRGPVRSALHVLQGEGLVETLPNGRMVTIRFGPEDLNDLLAIRHELESSAVRRGSSARTDIAPVYAAFAAIKREGASTDHLVELDIEFHRTLVELGGSRFLLSAWLALAPVIQAVITIGNRRLAREDPESNYLRIVTAHERILEPLSRYDAEAVVRILAEQFEITRAQFLPSDRPLLELL
jgi:DNA-binding GntR family transcriptional regulator